MICICGCASPFCVPAFKSLRLSKRVVNLVTRPSTLLTMSTDIFDCGLQLYGETLAFDTGHPKKQAISSFEPEELAIEDHDPVPPYLTEHEALTIINDILNSPQAKSELRTAVKDMGDSAYSIEVCFKNIAKGLEEALREVTAAQAQDLRRFIAEWSVHHKTYNDLLWDSRRVAGVARVTAKDFSGNFVSMMAVTDCTLDEKKKEIEVYRQYLQQEVKQSADLSQRFYDLREAVKQFQDDLMGLVASGQALEQEVQEIVANISDLTREISELTKAFLSSSSQAGLSTAGAGIFALSVICPALFNTKREGKASGVRDMDVKKEELKQQKELLVEWERSLGGMRRAHTIIDPLKSDMELIKEKLVVFGKIWQLIHADINAIETDLTSATKSACPSLFRIRLKTMLSTYTALADALYEFETNVHIKNVAVRCD
ncbi:hypothetical protein BKA82DRAFT_736139 [Pisolithus tinctorius]|uniref:Uncharacterized protein n=1 Tax=Pisolithus tinctorius Marx 270 TaxID=870435 RepID=A0A0C3P1T1_PISTI|nr:hypothetical protein BKA82DRAFT_736139 [Pisolithus tinctorius]KIO01289.1 hypothetical protein M404DRAFT_736139 [Pisolithus tinctorius Marx 270]